MDDGTGTAKLHPAHHHRRLLPGTLDPRIPHGHQPRHHLRIHLLLGLALGPGRRTAGRPPDDRNPGDPETNPETTPGVQSDCSVSRLKHNARSRTELPLQQGSAGGRWGVFFWQEKRCLSEASCFFQKKNTPHLPARPHNLTDRNPNITPPPPTKRIGAQARPPATPPPRPQTPLLPPPHPQPGHEG